MLIFIVLASICNYSYADHPTQVPNWVAEYPTQVPNWVAEYPTQVPNWVAEYPTQFEPADKGELVSAMRFWCNDRQEALLAHGDINTWKTTAVTDMSYLILESDCGGSFNDDISDWDVSEVTNMGGMFEDALTFNQPLNNWNVAKVTNMHSMFFNCQAFNQDLDHWNTGQVATMWRMFRQASAFNGAVGNWDVRNVKDMWTMFQEASAFNQPLGWDMGSVLDFGGMFYAACAFKQVITGPELPGSECFAGTFGPSDEPTDKLTGIDCGKIAPYKKWTKYELGVLTVYEDNVYYSLCKKWNNKGKRPDRSPKCWVLEGACKPKDFCLEPAFWDPEVRYKKNTEIFFGSGDIYRAMTKNKNKVPPVASKIWEFVTTCKY